MKLPIGDRHIAALQSLTAALDELQIRAVLIGGVAVSFLAEPRFTRDVDALIILDTSKLSTVLSVLKKYQLVPLFQGMVEFAQESRVLPLNHAPTGIVVDVMLGCLPFDIEVVNRAQNASVADIGILLPTPEDLVILKAIANRPKDQEDIRSIVAVYPCLDRARIRHWVVEYAALLETPGLWSEIERLLG